MTVKGGWHWDRRRVTSLRIPEGLSAAQRDHAEARARRVARGPTPRCADCRAYGEPLVEGKDGMMRCGRHAARAETAR